MQWMKSAGANVGGRRALGRDPLALVEPQISRVMFVRWRGSVMGDFLTGIRWGAWFVLAGITAAGLWGWLTIGHAVH